MLFQNRESKSKSTGFKVILEQLTEREWEQLVRKSLINADTKVSSEGTETTWIRAGEVPELSKYFSNGDKVESLNSFFNSLRSIFNELEEFARSLAGEKLIIPEQLYKTLEDYLNQSTDEVALTIGKIHGKPAFFVLLISEGKSRIVADIDIDTSKWNTESIQNWPEIGSAKAKLWNIKRCN